MRATAGVILDLLGNPTRRGILQLIAEEPKYFTELSMETGVRKMAIERHARQLEEFGVITSEEERIGRGRPRKYYEISTKGKLKVKISPGFFQANYWTLGGRRTAESDGHLFPVDEREQDPIKKLSALSRMAEKIMDNIRRHEDAIVRDEELLEKVKHIGVKTMKETGFEPIERRVLLNIMLSGKGKRSGRVAEDIGEEPIKVRRKLQRMKSKGILRYHHHNWRIK